MVPIVRGRVVPVLLLMLVLGVRLRLLGDVWRGHRSGRCLMYLGWGRPPEAGNHPLGAGAGRMPLPRPAAGYGAHSQGPGRARAVADAGAGGEVAAAGVVDSYAPLHVRADAAHLYP